MGITEDAEQPAYTKYTIPIRIVSLTDASLRVERFRIAEWRGPLPKSLAGSVAIATTDGSIVCGALPHLDTEEEPQ